MRLSYITLGAAVLTTALQSHALAATLVQWNFNSLVADGDYTTGSLLPSVNNTASLPTISDTGLSSSTTTVYTSSNTFFTTGTTTSTISYPLDNSSDPSAGDNSAFLIRNFPDQGANNDTAGVIIRVNTTGYNKLSLSWDQKTDTSASANYRVRYSTDGTNFTSVGSLFQPSAVNMWDANHPYNNGAGTPAGVSYNQWIDGISRDLSAISALNNNPTVYLEIVSEFDPNNPTQYANNHQLNNIYSPTNGSVRFDELTITGTPTPEPAGLAVLGIVATALYRRRS